MTVPAALSAARRSMSAVRRRRRAMQRAVEQRLGHVVLGRYPRPRLQDLHNEADLAAAQMGDVDIRGAQQVDRAVPRLVDGLAGLRPIGAMERAQQRYRIGPFRRADRTGQSKRRRSEKEAVSVAMTPSGPRHRGDN